MSEHIKPGVMKNINAKEVMVLKDQVACLPGQVISKTLAQNDHVSVTLFAFGAGEEIASHRAGGDAFVTALEGRWRLPSITMRLSLKRATPSLCHLVIPTLLKLLRTSK